MADHCLPGGAGWCPIGLAQRTDVGYKAHPDPRDGSPCLLGISCTPTSVRFFYCFKDERAGLGCPLTLRAEHVVRELLESTVTPFPISFLCKLGLQVAQNPVWMGEGPSGLAWLDMKGMWEARLPFLTTNGW